MEFVKQRCKTTAGRLCSYCSKHDWRSPKSFDGIPSPYPDYEKLPKYHYKDVFDTSLLSEDNTVREIDDFLPRARLKKNFHNGSVSLEKPETIERFCNEYIVEEEHVRGYLNHLLTLQRTSTVRQNQRTKDKNTRKTKGYEQYDRKTIASTFENMNKLYVEELNKYLVHHKLSHLGKKNDKIRRIMAHVALERNDAEWPENEGEEDGNSEDESVDECDSESDDDDEVVAFVDESDSETEVPVNTPAGSTRTRAGRLSIPNSRYLNWLA